MVLTNGNASLKELLASAETDDDFQAAEQLIDEVEAKIKNAPESRWIVHTLVEVAEFFRVSEQAVKQWRTQTPPMPGFAERGRYSKCRYDLSEIAAWRMNRGQGRASPELNTLREQEGELNAIKIERQRLELDREKGELVPLADVELFVATALIECRVVVMSIPEAIATSAPPELRDHARTEADRTCRAALTSLRRRLELSQLEQQPEADE